MGVNCLIFSGNSGIETSHNMFGLPIKQLSAGAYRIATELRNRGYSVQVVDFAHEKEFGPIHELVLKKFVDKDTLWIGFSINFLTHLLGYPYVPTKNKLDYLKEQNSQLDLHIRSFVDYARSLNSKVQFLIGGTRLIDLSHLGFYEFRGYADSLILEFTDKLCRGDIPKKRIYDYEIYDNFVKSKIDYQKNDILDYYKGLSIEISRGCIFRCKFCAHPLNGKTKGEWIKRSEVLYDEFISNYEKYGIKDYVFADDTYNDSPIKLEELYNNVFSKLPFKINFVTYLRLDLLYRYPHTIDILKDSGLKAAFFGIETLNAKAAKIIGKGMDPMKQMEFAAQLKQNQFKNINMTASWIYGLPTETKKTLIDMCSWIMSSENPFDSNSMAELGIKPKNFHTYQIFKSPFEDDIFLYDFEVFLDEENNLEWKYKDTDVTSYWCRDLAQKLIPLEYAKRKRMTTFYLPDCITLGIDQNDFNSLTPKEIQQKYDLQKMSEQSTIKYIKNLIA